MNTKPARRPKTRTVNFLLQDGGVGDHVASLSVVDYTLKKYPWITPLVWLFDDIYDLAKNVLPDNTQIFKFSEMRGVYQPGKPTKSTKWDGHTSSMKIHTLDYAFLKLLDENPPWHEKNYPQLKTDKLVGMRDFGLQDRYVVLTTGFTADVREFRPGVVNAVADWLAKRDITPVFLGQRDTKTGAAHVIRGTFREEIDYSRGVDMIDKTTLLEAAVVMNGALAVVGVDNGLLHVAGCTKSPIVGGFTTVRPEIRWPVRNGVLGWECYPVVPPETGKGVCGGRFCQQRTNFLYGQDYRKCFHENDSGLDKMCVSGLTAEMFMSRLEEILEVTCLSTK